MKVVYAPRALRDLPDIECYLAARSSAGSRNVLAAIKLAIVDFEHFPKIGVPIDAEGRYALPVRRYPYLVFYQVALAEVFILHIRHGARKPVEPDEE